MGLGTSRSSNTTAIQPSAAGINKIPAVQRNPVASDRPSTELILDVASIVIEYVGYGETRNTRRRLRKIDEPFPSGGCQSLALVSHAWNDAVRCSRPYFDRYEDLRRQLPGSVRPVPFFSSENLVGHSDCCSVSTMDEGDLLTDSDGASMASGTSLGLLDYRAAIADALRARYESISWDGRPFPQPRAVQTSFGASLLRRFTGADASLTQNIALCGKESSGKTSFLHRLNDLESVTLVIGHYNERAEVGEESEIKVLTAPTTVSCRAPRAEYGALIYVVDAHEAAVSEAYRRSVWLQLDHMLRRNAAGVPATDVGRLFHQDAALVVVLNKMDLAVGRRNTTTASTAASPSGVASGSTTSETRFSTCDRRPVLLPRDAPTALGLQDLGPGRRWYVQGASVVLDRGVELAFQASLAAIRGSE